MSRVFLPALLLIASAGIAHAQAHIDFAPAVTYTVGGNPEGAALLDFNDDGFLDLAVTSDQPNKIEFFANQGNGTFAAPFALLTGNETGPEGLAPADFNSDGHVDLAVALFGTDQVQLVFGDGSGHFSLGGTIAVGDEPSMIVAADFDADGWIDVAVNNRVSGDMSVLLNDGAGQLEAAVSHPVGVETRSIDAGDFTGDGLPDLAVSARDSRIVRLFENLGGTFQMFRDLSLGSLLEPEGVTFADFDGDGALDLVTATSGMDNQQHPSVFLQNNGGRVGIWVGPVNGQTLPGIEPMGIAAADFDLDGHVDVATSNSGSDNVSVNKNGGIGIFFVPVVYPVGQSPETEVLLAGDLDRNGAADLITLNQESEDVSVLMNRNSATVDAPSSPAIGGLVFHRVVPNPVVDQAYLTYDLARSAAVTLSIYDAAGRHVRTLEHATLPAGEHRLVWNGVRSDGTRSAPGVYIAVLSAAGEVRAQRLVLTR
ncbi:MAG: FG-GAP-like repeat-containing protein [Candidatus Eiseniibacteriota bacterium]